MHAIEEHDRGAVGFAGKLGKTWHGIASYKHYDNSVNIETAESIADYKVEKRPAFFYGENDNPVAIEDNFVLYRPDTSTVLYGVGVGEQYTVIDNLELTNFVNEGILKQYGNIAIESVGTLYNGQAFFLNLLVDEHVVKGDVSPTATRLAMFNFHGGKSVSACLHATRIVCMNTLRWAQSEGKANKTLKHFRHTKTVSERVQAHTVDLADIVGEIKQNNEVLDAMADVKILPAQFDSFLENLFPQENLDEGRTKSIALNKQDAIKEIYESKDDLKVLDHSVYRAFNAVTDWADHEMSLRGDDSSGKRWLSSLNGSADKVKQTAYKQAVALI